VVGALLGKLLVRLLLVLWHLGGRFGLGLYRSPDLSSLAPLIGWCAAAGYSLLAGFSLPTQRALIAVTVVVVARLAYRKLAPVACFLWALLLIALSQPLAALSAGFWLSFSAVGILVAWFSPWRSADSWFQWKRGLTAQFALLVGMSVPLALLGCLLLLVSSDWAGAAWRVAEWSVDQLWRVLGFFPADSGFVSLPLGTSIATLAAVLFAVIMLLLPKGVPLRWLGLLPLGLQAAFAAPEPPLRVVVLDVGQGLAVVVETPNHTAVYDTGSEFSDRFSTGDGIIAPYLWSRGRAKIDATIVSHEDGDHAGGFASLQQSIASRQLMTGPAVISRRKLLVIRW
jgi:competence protein ComEC